MTWLVFLVCWFASENLAIAVGIGMVYWMVT